MERTADVIDQAGQVEQMFRDEEVRVARALSAPETHPDYDGLHCVEVDCGVEIPIVRRKLFRVRCVDCQTRKEGIGRQFGAR
jgi:RNA polymerase-binding transcription factor DksA